MLGFILSLPLTYLESYKDKNGWIGLLFTFSILWGVGTAIMYYLLKNMSSDKSRKISFMRPFPVIFLGGVLGVGFQYYVITKQNIGFDDYLVVGLKMGSWAIIGAIWARILYSKLKKLRDTNS